MSGSRDLSREELRRRRFRVLRWVAAIALVAVLAVEVVLLAPSLAAAMDRLSEVNWWWVGAAVAAQAVSMSAFGRLQRRLLAAAAVPVRLRDSTAVVYAANAMSVSLPGGPLFSTTFVFRQTRLWGANRLVASWQLAMSGLLATSSLALIGVAGGLLVGSSTNIVGLVLAIAGALALVLAVRFLVTHPGVLGTVAGRGVRAWNSVRGQPPRQGMERIEELQAQLAAVQLGKRDLAVAAWWATFNWVADIACFGFACLAAGAYPSVGGLLIAFTAGKVVATAPLLPGGLGAVDGALTAALVASGLAASAAIPAVIVFRLISFPLLGAVGWLVFAVRFRNGGSIRRPGRDADADPDAPESLSRR